MTVPGGRERLADGDEKDAVVSGAGVLRLYVEASLHMSCLQLCRASHFAEPVLMQMLYHVPWDSRAAGQIWGTGRRAAILTTS